MGLRFGKAAKRQPAPAQTNPGPAASAGLPGVTVCAISLLGGRKTQQDVLDYRLLPGGTLAAALCDGMGGLNGGEQAARTACDGFFAACGTAEPQTAEEFRQIARQLDRRVAALRGAHGRPLEGGSTLVAALLGQGGLAWLAVGDSRIGLWRSGTLRWLNRLHNYRLELEEALRAGELSRDEYENELPRGQALVSYLGCGGLKYVDARTGLDWRPGDRLLLCSDGFADLLPSPALDALLGGETDLAAAVLPRLEEKGKSADNASAIVIRCLDTDSERSEYHEPGTL